MSGDGRYAPHGDMAALAAGYEELFEVNQTTLDWCDEAVVILDPRRHIMQLNQRFSRLFGVSAEGHSSVTTIDHLFASPVQLAGAIQQLNQGRVQEWAAEVAMYSADGSVFAASSRMRRIDVAGKLAGYAGYFRDLTPSRAQERTMGQSRLWELLANLAYAVSHDLNNQFAVILGYNELAQPDLSGPARAMLAEVSPAATRGGDLCRQVMECMGRDGGSPEPVPVRRMAEEMLPVLQLLMKNKAKVAFSGADARDMTMLLCGPVSIRQTLISMTLLLGEVLESSRDEIRVTAGTVHLDEEAAGSVLGADLKGTFGYVEVRAPGKRPEAARQAGVTRLLNSRRPEPGSVAGCLRTLVRDQQGTIHCSFNEGEGWSLRACFPAA